MKDFKPSYNRLSIYKYQLNYKEDKEPTTNKRKTYISYANLRRLALFLEGPFKRNN